MNTNISNLKISEQPQKVLTTRFGAFSHSTAVTFSELHNITDIGTAQISQQQRKQRQ